MAGGRSPEAVRSMEWCAPSMGANLWGESPLWENRIGLMRAILTTSRRQGLAREGWSGGSPSANVRGDGQKPHSQGRGSRGKLAHDGKAHRFDAYGKCGACALTVRVLTWGDLRRERCEWMTTLPGLVPPGYQDPAPWRAARCVSKKEAATSSSHTARPAAMRAVMGQKSAKAIVGIQESGYRRA